VNWELAWVSERPVNVHERKPFGIPSIIIYKGQGVRVILDPPEHPLPLARNFHKINKSQTINLALKTTKKWLKTLF
jgi:hypothetical protein